MKTRILTQYPILLPKLREQLSSAQHLELCHKGGKAECPLSKSTKYYISHSTVVTEHGRYNKYE